MFSQDEVHSWQVFFLHGSEIPFNTIPPLLYALNAIYVDNSSYILQYDFIFTDLFKVRTKGDAEGLGTQTN